MEGVFSIGKEKRKKKKEKESDNIKEIKINDADLKFNENFTHSEETH